MINTDEAMEIIKRVAEETVRQYMQRAAPQRKEEAFVKILLMMQDFDIDPDHVKAEFNHLLGRRRKKIAPKYMNPENPAQTWAGRGSKPHWLKAQLNSGRALDEMLVTSSNSIIATHF